MQSFTLTRRLFGFSLHRHVHRHLRDHFIPHEGNKHIPHVLHHRALFLYSALLILVKFSVLSSPFLLPYNLAQTAAITPENIVNLTNGSRTDYGLPELLASPKLAVAAANKARDMLEQGYFAHFSPEGVSPWFWIVGSGYEYAYAGENLAIRFNTAEGVNAAWLASSAHRANILSENFSEIGVAVVTDEFGAEGPATVVVQMFGAPAKRTVPAKTESTAAKPLQVSNLKTDTAPAALKLPKPRLLYPLKDSFVKQRSFSVLGNGTPGSIVRVFVDGVGMGDAQVSQEGKFKFALPKESALSESAHTLYVRALGAESELSERSDEVRIMIDATPPEVDKNQFSFLPISGKLGTYSVSVGVSADSIRTLVSVGTDSAELLLQAASKLWTGEISLRSTPTGDSLPIEIYAQDLAGNEIKSRLGLLAGPDVRGVFNFLSGAIDSPKESISLFWGLATIEDFGSFAQKFYLSFVVFLASALLLKIAVKRHIHHPRTVAFASGVMMLAMVLFVF